MHRPALITIGGSAGSGTVIEQILDSLPAHFPIPIVIVRHRKEADLNQSYISILSKRYGVSIVEPDDKQPLLPSTVYYAPAGYHLLIDKDGFALSLDEKVHFCRPSIDVFFLSALEAYGKNLLAILLTGANRDGAHGLFEIKSAGGKAMVQDPQSAEYPVMPEAGKRLCKKCSVASVESIIKTISSLEVGLEEVA